MPLSVLNIGTQHLKCERTGLLRIITCGENKPVWIININTYKRPIHFKRSAKGIEREERVLKVKKGHPVENLLISMLKMLSLMSRVYMEKIDSHW